MAQNLRHLRRLSSRFCMPKTYWKRENVSVYNSFPTFSLPQIAGIEQTLQLSDNTAESNRKKAGFEKLMFSRRGDFGNQQGTTFEEGNGPGNSTRTMNSPSRDYHDKALVQQGRRFDRNFSTWPYCAYCRQLSHLAYNGFQRSPPPLQFTATTLAFNSRGSPRGPNSYRIQRRHNMSP